VCVPRKVSAEFCARTKTGAARGPVAERLPRAVSGTSRPPIPTADVRSMARHREDGAVQTDGTISPQGLTGRSPGIDASRLTEI
jgi:hypothetical protein